MQREALEDVVGREIYTRSGVYIGDVEDTVVDLEQGAVVELAVAPINTDIMDRQSFDGRGIRIPVRWVRDTDDIILIEDVLDSLPHLGEDSQENT